MAYNILMIAPTPFFADRGCHVQIYEQMRSLIRLGNCVTLCTYHNGRNLPGFDIRRIMNIPWYRKLEAGPSYHKLYLDLLLFVKSLRTAWETKPDIIHGHLHEGCLIGFVISRLMGIPLLFDLQGSLTGEMCAHRFLKNDTLHYYAWRIVEKAIDNLADVVVTVSTEMVEELRNDFGVTPEKVFLTLDGADTEDFRPGLDVGDLKRELNLPDGKKIVVYLGLLNEYQGVDCMIRSIPHVVSRFLDVHFLIMGFPNEDKYRLMAEELGVAEFVTFTGVIDYREAPRYLCIGNIALGPKLGKTEADGKIYNYMACGLPTVASDTMVHREILGDTGIYAKVGDPLSLAESLLYVLSNEDKAKEIGQKARERVVSRFSWDNVAKRLTNCYAVALERSNGGWNHAIY